MRGARSWRSRSRLGAGRLEHTKGLGHRVNTRGSVPLRRLATLGLVLMVALAGCTPPLHFAQLSGSQGPVASNEVVMGISNFQQQQVTVKAGQSVIFTDPTSSGGVHYICVGTNVTCKPTPGTPAQLAGPNGLAFTNGAAPVSVSFKTPGVYEVICTIHPGMKVTVNVTK